MMNPPLVSIIIPTFNRAHLIGETLDSIIAQTYPNWECIVVDDGSTDTTEELLAEYNKNDSRIRFYKRPEFMLKSGNSCRNYGFSLSKGEYINFFDSDDVMLNHFIETLIIGFQENTIMSIGSYNIVDDRLNYQSSPQLQLDSYLLKDYLFWKLPLLTPSILFRKSFLEKKSLFDPSIKRGQETDFFLNVFKGLKNENISIKNIPIFLYRLHPNSITAGTKHYNYDYSISHIKIRSKAYLIGCELNDFEIIKNSHLHLIILLFKAIKPHDITAVKAFYSIYLKQCKHLSFVQKMEIRLMLPILYITKLPSKILEKRWINFLT